MQFTQLFTLIASASMVMAAAVPGWGGDGGDGGNSGDKNVCSQDEKEACCNTDSGILNILGGSCTLSVINGQCSQGAVACCPTDAQTGLIDVGSICNLINV